LNFFKNIIIYTLLTSLSYFLSAKLVFPLSLSESASVFAIWPPTGVALIFLLSKGRIVIPGIFLGAFFLNLTLSSPIIAFEVAIGNTIGPYVVFLLIKNYIKEDLFYDTQSIINFIFFSGVGSVITSGLGTYALYMNGLLSAEYQVLGLLVWLFGDFIGFLLLTSLYISFSLDRQYNRSLTHSIFEIFLMILLLFFISAVVFGSGFFFENKYPLEYLILFPLLWASVRFKPGITLVFLFLIAVLAIIGTASGYSQFSMDDKRVSLIFLQFFIFTITFAVLLMTAQRHQMLRILYDKEQLSMIDQLTQIGNRRYFIEILEHENNINQRYKRPISLIMFDIDYFKNINDEFGHQEGDNVLVDLTSLVKSELRVSDNFARWGGEEFIILLPENNLANAKIVAQKLRKAIEKHIFKVSKNITCSFGVIECGEDETFEKMIKRVDDKLYEAKRAGRNRVFS
jgi:diguanylate cyclase (GGDEF)-like protein